jgi:hypothetical protein
MKSKPIANSLAELPADSLSFLNFKPGWVPTLTRPSAEQQSDLQLSVYPLASSFQEEEPWPHGGLNE